MRDLIDRKAAIEEITFFIQAVSDLPGDPTKAPHENQMDIKRYNDGLVGAISILTAMPSAEPEQKKGEWGYQWIVHGDGRLPTEIYSCSECGLASLFTTKFCPHCGCKMEEDE